MVRSNHNLWWPVVIDPNLMLLQKKESEILRGGSRCLAKRAINIQRLRLWVCKWSYISDFKTHSPGLIPKSKDPLTAVVLGPLFTKLIKEVWLSGKGGQCAKNRSDYPATNKEFTCTKNPVTSAKRHHMRYESSTLILYKELSSPIFQSC